MWYIDLDILQEDLYFGSSFLVVNSTLGLHIVVSAIFFPNKLYETLGLLSEWFKTFGISQMKPFMWATSWLFTRMWGPNHVVLIFLKFMLVFFPRSSIFTTINLNFLFCCVIFGIRTQVCTNPSIFSPPNLLFFILCSSFKKRKNYWKRKEKIKIKKENRKFQLPFIFNSNIIILNSNIITIIKTLTDLQHSIANNFISFPAIWLVANYPVTFPNTCPWP